MGESLPEPARRLAIRGFALRDNQEIALSYSVRLGCQGVKKVALGRLARTAYRIGKNTTSTLPFPLIEVNNDLPKAEDWLPATRAVSPNARVDNDLGPLMPIRFPL
jgi:hypothetical protein